MEKFSWIPFYKEFATKLLEYKNNREELVKKIRDLEGEGKGKHISYIKDYLSRDIHPFAVFGIFNRSGEENRKEICTRLKKLFSLKENIPSDFDGVPTLNPQLSWWGDFENKTECEENWKLFEDALRNELKDEDFIKDFDLVLKQRNAGRASISMELFWINPNLFVPLDSNTIDYLKKTKFFNDLTVKDFNGEKYLAFVKEIKNRLEKEQMKEKSIPEISCNAYLEKQNSSTKKDSNEVSKKEDLVENLKELLKASHNLILHGAPGTGKTYLAKKIAKEIGAETDFVQFHPSYDYTDFVEGLRPKKVGSDEIGFELKDGVFKEFCKKALLSQNLTSEDLKLLNPSPIVWKVSLGKTGDNPIRTDCIKNGWIRIGWREYGDVEDFGEYDFKASKIAQELQNKNVSIGKDNLLRFQKEMRVGDIVLSCFSETKVDAIGIITGDYEYREKGEGYPRYRQVKWLLKNVQEDIVKINNGKKFTLSTVYKSNVSANDALEIVKRHTKVLEASSSPKNFVFIIDEINRGEMSKIFGELFFAIEPGYRGKSGKIKTQYQNLIDSDDVFRDGFFVPENVYIIGTMNDIDRSVDTMDFAFRRRFAFKEIKANENIEMLDAFPEDVREKAINRMKHLNAAIEKIDGLSSAYHIGGAYFKKLEECDYKFEKLWTLHLEGLLREYLRGQENADDNLKKLKDAYDNEAEPKSDSQNSKDSFGPREGELSAKVPQGGN